MDFGQINILVVDDDRSTLLLMERLLRKEGLHIVSANSGAEAISLVASYDFALILMDVMMPEENGIETAEIIRNNPQKRHIPIIFVTSLNREMEYEFQGYEAGAVDFLYKPVAPRILCSKVRVFADVYRREQHLKQTTFELEKTMLSLKSEMEMRINAQKAVKASEERYRSLFDTCRDGIVFQTLSGEIETANNAYLDMLGYTLWELKCMDTSDYLAGEWLEYEMNTVNMIGETGDSGEYELEYIGKDGVRLPVRSRTWLIQDSSGKPLRVLKHVRDITEEKQLETQLRQAQKMEAVGTLAGGIAHDFNNILAAIMGYVELAQFDVSEGDPVSHSLAQVLKASHRAKKLVGHILAFSRQSVHEKKPVYIHHIVKESLDLLRASLPSTIEIRQNIPVKLKSVQADSTQIHQVLMNIGTNAYHSMAKNGGVLDVTLFDFELRENEKSPHLGLWPGHYLKLTLKDTGCGMNRATLARIFDPYFTTKEIGAGTGMGLSVVHGIIKSHGGVIDVQSEPGKGSVFTIYFPVVDIAAETEIAILETLPVGNERILFIDDEDVLAGLGMSMLERLGYEVTAETNSLHALELFRAGPERFDLVITDMTMPDMTGLQLAKSIRSLSPHIPIILCTGYNKQVDKKIIKNFGIDYLLLKPLEIRELATVIREAAVKDLGGRQYGHA